jgi:hypothetical protein
MMQTIHELEAPVMLLWVYIHTGQARKTCLWYFGIESSSFDINVI